MRGGRPAAGQATVELALSLPFVVAALLVVVQVGIAARAQLLVTHAAREAARAAAVGEAVPSAAGLDPDNTSIEVHHGGTGPGASVTVVVRTRIPTELPLIGPLVPDLDLRGSATMRVE